MKCDWCDIEASIEAEGGYHLCAGHYAMWCVMTVAQMRGQTQAEAKKNAHEILNRAVRDGVPRIFGGTIHWQGFFPSIAYNN